MMTRTGSRKSVDAQYWHGRLDAARAYEESAENLLTLARAGTNANPAISQIVLAAIAYGDCLTAKRGSVINQQDHAAAPRLLRDVMGAALPATQETRYRRILANKDASQYGARRGSLDQARRLLKDLNEFAAWAEAQL